MSQTVSETVVSTLTDTSNEGSSDSQSSVTTVEAPGKRAGISDARLSDASKWEKTYTWLYFNQAQGGWKCKYCEIAHGDDPNVLSGSSRGAWSHKPVVFRDNPGKKIRRHVASKLHETAELRLTSKKIESALDKASQVDEEKRRLKRESNKLYIGKLVKCVHWLARNNLPIKQLYSKLVHFLSDEIQEPITSQYLQTCPLNASYTSHVTADGLLKAANAMTEEEMLSRARRATDYTILADEATSDASHEIFAIFLSWWDEELKQLCVEYMGLRRVASSASSILMDTIVEFAREKDLDLTKIRFACLDGTNSMSGEISGLQRRIRNVAPHSLYINCRSHRLALCFKHLIHKYQWLDEIDRLLLGLWKTFHFSGKRKLILEELQKSYGQKPLSIVKAAVTRWLSHGRACGRVLDRYGTILQAIGDILSQKPDAELAGYRNSLLKEMTVYQICLLHDALTQVNALSLLLQTDKIEFKSVNFELKAINDRLENMKSLDSVYLSSVAEAQEKIKAAQINPANVVAAHTRKRRRTEALEVVQDSAEGESEGFQAMFHRKTVIPFISDLQAEISSAFSTAHMPVIGAFDCLDVNRIPTEPELVEKECTLQLRTLYEFYGSQKENVFEERRVVADRLIDCLQKTLELEYHGFATYMVKKREDTVRSLKENLKTVERKLASVTPKTRQKVKSDLEKEKNTLQKRLKEPVSTEKILTDEIMVAAFPNIRKLIKISAVMPVSQAVVERGFSRMNLICTESRTSLDPVSLDCLMRLSYFNRQFTDDEMAKIIERWSADKERRIFDDDM